MKRFESPDNIDSDDIDRYRQVGKLRLSDNIDRQVGKLQLGEGYLLGKITTVSVDIDNCN